MSCHKGSCHCGAVTFKVEAPRDAQANRCNCSICRATGFIHLIVEKDAFELLSGEDDLTTYSFNTHVAKHTFCKHCGIKSFYIPRSHPKGISVNVNALDPSTISDFIYGEFDGLHWEDHIDELRETLS